LPHKSALLGRNGHHQVSAEGPLSHRPFRPSLVRH